MKKNTKFILLTALLVLMVASAAILYKRLALKYQEENSVPEAAAVTEESTIKAADFTVYDTGGNAVSLSDMTGKPVIVNFWTTWCKYCVEELPLFDRYAADYKDRINFMMVDLTDGNLETEEKALAFVQNAGYDFPLYFDTDESASNVYRVMNIPMTLLIDKNGNLYKVHTGLMNEETLKQYIEILTEGTNGRDYFNK